METCQAGRRESYVWPQRTATTALAGGGTLGTVGWVEGEGCSPLSEVKGEK